MDETLRTMSEVELLRTHSAVIAELRQRGVVKTENNPLGDYTEWLVCRLLGLESQPNSKAGFDACDSGGIRYQIKGRCSNANSVQFSPIRNLEGRGFDFVIAVVFNDDYSVRQAVKVPYRLVDKVARYQGHVNGHIIIWSPQMVAIEGVEDITCSLDGSLGLADSQKSSNWLFKWVRFLKQRP